jgi:hypothetical protein
MGIKNIACVFCFLTIGLIACASQTPVNEYGNIRPTNLPSNKSVIATSTPISAAERILPTTPQATPEWKNRNLTGKIVYVDRTANQIVIMDANGGSSKDIFYIPGETYEPYMGSPIKWSHNGHKLAFGCQKLPDSPDWKFFPAGRGDNIRISLCVLDLLKNMQGQNNNISQGLQVIELPEHYMPLASEGAYSNPRLFASLAWLMNDEEIVLTPFCIVKVAETKTDCNNWGGLDHLDEVNKELLQNAEFIAPSPVDAKKWALTIDNLILIMDMADGQVEYISMEYKDLSVYWSPDGNKMAVLGRELNYPYDTVVGMLDIRTSSFMKIIWVGKYGISIEPGLMTARPVTGSYFLNSYFPRQNIAWSQDGHNLVMNVYLGLPFAESARIYTGMYFFELEMADLFPVRSEKGELEIPAEFRPEWNVDVIAIKEFKLFTSPDWYACDDPENVCELYK